MLRPVMVDPQFAAQLRTLRRQRALSLRELAKLACYSHTYLWEIEAGRKRPTIEVAAQLDTILEAGGTLAGMVTEVASIVNPDDEHRLADVARDPRRLDGAVIEALTATLAQQRRLEDTIGSTLLVEPTRAQLTIIETLLRDAPGRLHRPMMDLAAQWAQFAGWLYASSGNPPQATTWYLRALEWASEAGNPDLVATALSMRGHLAWTGRQYPSMLHLSQAALWIPAGAAVRAAAKQQEARAYACLGDTRACDTSLDEAETLAHQAFEQPERTPPWMYFYDPGLFALQRGLAQLLLTRHDRAVELLTGGLERLTLDVRRSEWIAWYVCRLGAAYAATGDAASAVTALEEAMAVAAATGSARLTAEAEHLARQLGL